MHSSTIQHEALSRAVSGQSFANYQSIFEGFMAKGIPEAQILPRENVFTYNAWKALGRQVRKGEHGVKCVTFIVCEDKKAEEKTGKKSSFRRPWTTTVFHVSQTDPIDNNDARLRVPAESVEVRTWEERVRALESEGLTRSDAQAVVDAEDSKEVQS